MHEANINCELMVNFHLPFFLFFFFLFGLLFCSAWKHIDSSSACEGGILDLCGEPQTNSSTDETAGGKGGGGGGGA